MRYVCVGVGGVGGSVAARLALGGHEVVAVARGEHLSVTQSQGGLRLRTPTEDVIAPLTAVAHVGDMVPPLAPEDIVIVATKVHQVAAVLTELAAASTAIGSGLGACPTVPSPTQCPMQQ
jgi:2-dehydropantoate 2-reductase